MHVRSTSILAHSYGIQALQSGRSPCLLVVLRPIFVAGVTAMPEMTNLMDALEYLQEALDAGTVRMQRCEIYPGLRALVDEPGGDLRLTYAKVIAGTVQSIAVFVLTKSVGHVARFSLGFAVHESRRGRGLGKEIVEQAIDEMSRGLTRNGMSEFYVVAAVPESNIPAN